MTQADRESMAARYRVWPTEDLIRAVRFDALEYQPEALALIEEELAARNQSVGERHESEVVAAEIHHRDAQEWIGVKGWLVVLLLGFSFSSFAALFNAVRSIGYSLPEVRAFAFLKGAILGIFGLVTVGLFLARHRRAPACAKILLVLATAISLFESFYFALQDWSAFAIPYGAMIAGGVWFTYLSVSKRVKATYGP